MDYSDTQWEPQDSAVFKQKLSRAEGIALPDSPGRGTGIPMAFLATRLIIKKKIELC